MSLDKVLLAQTAAANDSAVLEDLSKQDLELKDKQLKSTVNIEKTLTVQSDSIAKLANIMQAAVSNKPVANKVGGASNVIPFPIKAGSPMAAQPSREDKLENDRAVEKQTELLEKIEENTRQPLIIEQPKESEEKDKGVGIGKLGMLGTALAVALGGIVGAVSGYVKALVKMNKMLFSGIESAIVAIGKFFPSIKKMLFNIEVTVVLGLEMIKDAFGKVVQKALAIFDNIKDFVSKIMNSKFVKSVVDIFNKVVGGIKNFFAPIVDSFKVIEEASAPVSKAVTFIKDKIAMFSEFFSNIGAKLGAFGKIFGSVAKIVSKIAYPLTIIMTLWDTVKGAYEGFQEDGIVGALAGAVKGLISSLITAPIDMLKDAVSWILDMFGFDKASKFLDSFSFDEIMKSFIDAVFHPIDTIKSMFTKVMEFFENSEIPEIGFTIPFINKKVSIGPFKPFSKDSKADAGSMPQSSPTPTQQSSNVVASKPQAMTSSLTTMSRTERVQKREEILTEYREGKITQEEATQKIKGLVDAPTPSAAQTVASASAKNEEVRLANGKAAAPAPTVIAPTTISNSTQNQVIRLPARNLDPSVRDFMRSRYA